jgi:ABC-type glycerol-3-phosphate transport system substrate-binding protein
MIKFCASIQTNPNGENSPMRTHPTNFAYRLLCLLVIFGLLLSACQTTPQTQASTTSEPTQPGDTPRPSERPAEPTATLPPADTGGSDSDEHPIITFAASEYDRTLYEPLIEQFNRDHPEMTVQFAALPEYTGDPENDEIFADYYRMQASAGDTSLLWGMAAVPALYFRELQPLIEADPTSNANDFWPGALEACQDLEGRQLGIPMSINLSGIFYDPAAFKAAGVPLPKPGWTWADFQDAIAALAKTDGDQIRYGLAEQYTSVLSPIVEAAIEDNGGEVTTEMLQPVVQWYLDLAKTKAIYPPLYSGSDSKDVDWEARWQEWDKMWRSEDRPVMWPGSLADSMPGTDYVPPSETDPLAGLAIKQEGFAPYPVSADNPNDKTTPLWSQCVVISAGSQNPRAAWKWVNFLTTQRMVREGYGPWESLQLPSRISVADSAGYWNALPAGIEESIRFIVAHAWYGSTYPDLSYSTLNAVYKVVSGKADLETALAEAEAQRITDSANITPSPTPNKTPVVVATPQPTLSPDAVVVKYYNQSWGPDREALKALVAEYNKAHPESSVILQSDYYPGENEDYLVGLTQNFDCFTWYNLSYSGEKEPELLSLDTLMDAEGPEFVQDFDPGFLNAFRKDGLLYGLPAYNQPQLMGYNADLLARRGVEPPAGNWTFDEFIQLATQVSSAKEGDLSYGFFYSDWENFLFNSKGAMWADLSVDPPIPMMDTPGFTEALAWIAGLNKDGVFLIQDNENWEKTQNAMQDGQIAFWMAQAGQPNGWYFSDAEPPFKVGITTMPIIENPIDPYLYWNTDQAHFISANSKNPQVCWNWMKYLTEQPTGFIGVPARKSVQNSPAWEAVVGQDYAEIYRKAAVQTTRVDSNNLETYSSPIVWPLYTWRQAIIDAMLKGDDYQKIIPQSQQKAVDYLACMVTVDREKLDNDQLQEEVNRCAKQADPDGPWNEGGVRGGGGGGG